MPQPPATTRRDRYVLVALVVGIVLATGGALWWALAAGSDSGGDGKEITSASNGAPSGVDVTERGPRELVAEVVEAVPHDPTVFTEGLQVVDGIVYESSGLVGASAIYRYDRSTFQKLSSLTTEPTEFAEGLTMLPDGRLVQLTWKDGIARVRDPETLKAVGTFEYEGEGWGICYDKARSALVMSDGTNRLTFRDPTTFAVTGSVEVMVEGNPLNNLNELECTTDGVYANVWQTDTIVRIDTTTGTVLDRVDASNLLAADERANADVLNGIAQIDGGRFLVTGKYWPHSFIVRFVEPSTTTTTTTTTTSTTGNG